MWQWSTGKEDLAERQAALGRVLLATLERGGGAVHYFQGMHDIAAVLMMVAGERAAVELLSRLFRAGGVLHRWAAPDLAPVVDLIGDVLPLVRLADPALFSFLQRSQVLPLFATGWVLTWFTHDTDDIAAAAALVDVLFRPGTTESTVVYMVVRYMLACRDAILAQECAPAPLHFFFTRAMPRIVATPAGPDTVPVAVVTDTRDLEAAFSLQDVRASRTALGTDPLGKPERKQQKWGSALLWAAVGVGSLAVAGVVIAKYYHNHKHH